MESLFEQSTVQKFTDRINRLDNKAPAQWGAMSVAQMLAHCQKPFQIASGELVPKINPVIKFLFGKMARKQLLNDPQFKQSSPTFAEAKIADQRDFEAEKKKLIAAIERFREKGAEGIIKEPHPFFGELTVANWDRMQVKHLDHHLRQFGA